MAREMHPAEFQRNGIEFVRFASNITNAAVNHGVSMETLRYLGTEKFAYQAVRVATGEYKIVESSPAELLASPHVPLERRLAQLNLMSDEERLAAGSNPSLETQVREQSFLWASRDSDIVRYAVDPYHGDFTYLRVGRITDEKSLVTIIKDATKFKPYLAAIQTLAMLNEPKLMGFFLDATRVVDGTTRNVMTVLAKETNNRETLRQIVRLSKDEDAKKIARAKLEKPERV